MNTSKNTSPSDAYDSELDGHPLSIEAIQLSPEQIEQAQAQARPIQDPATLWQTYLNGLAQLGFEQWLQNRLEDYSPRQSWGDALDGLNINGFRVCLLPQSHQPDEMISLPQRAVDLAQGLAQGRAQRRAQDPAHFFVIVAIAEEEGSVEIYAVLRQDQLLQRRSLLSLNANQTYEVPLSWFNPDANSLLLYLRCSAPAAFEQSVTSDVVDSSSLLERTSAPLRTVGQATLNTALWLEGQLDELAQSLAWQLLPPLQFQAALRSSSGAVPEPLQEMPEDSNYYRLIQELRDRNVPIPDTVRPAYQDLELAGQPVRLYALSWPMQPEEGLPPEWTLVVIVGPLPQQRLPREIGLIVEDQDQVLVQKQLEADTDECLFAEVVGGLNEMFSVKLQLDGQLLQTLPDFSFQSWQSSL